MVIVKAFSHKTQEANSMRIKYAFVVSTLESSLERCALDTHRVNPPLEVDWNRIGTEFIVYSSNNDKITHCYSPLNSNIVEALHLRPPQTLHLPSKIQTTMVCHAGKLLTRCCRQRNRLPSGLV